MYVNIQSRKNLIIDVFRPELSKLFTLELKNLPYLPLFYIRASAYINPSASNLVTIYMYSTVKSRMTSIKGIIRPEYPELFALEFEIRGV